MLLPFNVKYDELMDQTKLQTGRLDHRRWFDWAERHATCMNPLPRRAEFRVAGPLPLHIYWRSPRNGGVRLGEGLLQKLCVTTFGELTTEDAVKDGFKTLLEFQKALVIRNHKPTMFPLKTRLVLLTWEWTDGPYDAVCHRCMKRARVGPHVDHCRLCCDCTTKEVK